MTEYTLLTAIGEVEDELLERSEKPTQKWYWKPLALIAACLCLVTVLAVRTFLFPGADKATAEQSANSSTVQHTEDCTADASAVPGEQKSRIVVFELGKEPAQSSSDIGLVSENYVAMTTRELEDYYGASLRPGWMPKDLNGETVLYGGIYENPERDDYDGTPYYDQNSLRYTDPVEENLQKGKFISKADFEAAVAHGRSLTVTAAKAHPIFYDVVIGNAENAAQEGKLSTIHGVEALIYHYTFQKADYYGARFMLGGTHFEVIGKNLTQNEFIRVLESVL
ncbi:MAG: hypothetical protein KBS74_04985 [Clostridiales bacterium]|nr:hypothetical protein [Candidatus Cacconaster stercorequi]